MRSQRHHPIAAAAVIFLLSSNAARADLPDGATLLADLGYSADEIAQVQSGKIVRKSMDPASDREIVAGMAFQVKASPADFVKELRSGALAKVDENTLASGALSAAPSAADFAKLTLAPDAAKDAKAYGSASPGSDLNLSAAEITAFSALGSGAAAAAVEDQVRSALLARVQAYQSGGLTAIAPYERGGGNRRSAGDELRTASMASKAVQKYAPNAFGLLTSYPQGKPAGTEEVFRWLRINAHDVPTNVLTHVFFIPDGNAWIVVQRQFYVSTGYNAEQAVAALLPAADGTVVIYANRTSTDQVAGFGGGTKRSIGSKMLSSQLESLFERLQAAAK